MLLSLRFCGRRAEFGVTGACRFFCSGCRSFDRAPVALDTALASVSATQSLVLTFRSELVPELEPEKNLFLQKED